MTKKDYAVWLMLSLAAEERIEKPIFAKKCLLWNRLQRIWAIKLTSGQRLTTLQQNINRAAMQKPSMPGYDRILSLHDIDGFCGYLTVISRAELAVRSLSF